MKDKVKNVYEVSFVNSDTLDANVKLHETYSFNSAGYLEEKTLYGKWFRGSMWRYNYSSPGIILYRISCSKYDSSGFISGLRLDDSTFYKYLSKEQMLEMDSYNKQGSLISKEFHYYDNKGNETHEVNQNDKGVAERSVKYTYDSAGNQIERIPEGQCKGCPPQSTRDSSVYDKNGRVITTFQFKSKWDTKYFLKLVYTYDDKGNMATWTTIRYSGEKKSVAKLNYEYTYDSYGNWLERKTYQQDTPEGVIKRTIEYYK